MRVGPLSGVLSFGMFVWSHAHNVHHARVAYTCALWQVDVGVTELLFRQTNFLIRNMKREMAKQHHAMKFNGGRNPSGKVTKLDE